jgi:hypothetical protein
MPTLAEMQTALAGLTPPLTTSLNALADQFPDSTVDDFVAILKRRPDLHDAAFRMVALAIFAERRNSLRRTAIALAPTVARGGPAASPHLGRIEARVQLYDYPMPVGGKALGEATEQDLHDAAQFHRNRSEAELARSQMFLRILRAVRAAGGTGTVRSLIPEHSLAVLMEDAAS